MSILSFNGNKIITTSGGGALVCNTLEQKNKAFFFLLKPEKMHLIISILEIGYNYRMSNISAGIEEGQMEVFG